MKIQFMIECDYCAESIVFFSKARALPSEDFRIEAEDVPAAWTASYAYGCCSATCPKCHAKQRDKA